MGCGVHRGYFKGIKRNKPKIDQLLPSRAVAKSELNHSSNLPLCFYGMQYAPKFLQKNTASHTRCLQYSAREILKFPMSYKFSVSSVFACL